MTSDTSRSSFVVVGGGIAGLAAALAIVPYASSVTVLERNRRFTETGAGIQLGPNAFAALAKLGLQNEVLQHALPVRELSIRDAQTSATIVALPLDEYFEMDFGFPYAVAHRGQLHRMLLEACRRQPGIELVTNAQVIGVTESSESIGVRLSDETFIGGDLLVGADGLHSRIRTHVVDDGAPRPAGHVAYRAIVQAEEFPQELPRDSSVLWAAADMHIVHYPLTNGRSFNVVATRVERVDTMFANRIVASSSVQAAFPGVTSALQRLLGTPKEWRAWSLADRAPTNTWHRGRAVLVGDAAHPMLQYAAQGACQALEDAAVLGRLLETLPAEAAVAGLGPARSARTARVQRTARWLGEAIYHPAGTKRSVRDRMVASLDAGALRNAIRWLYLWSPDGQAPATSFDTQKRHQA